MDKHEYGGALPLNEFHDAATSHLGSISLVHIGSMLAVSQSKSGQIGDVENLSPLCWGLNSSHTGYSQSLF
jgi:hypothetical protein